MIFSVVFKDPDDVIIGKLFLRVRIFTYLNQNPLFNDKKFNFVLKIEFFSIFGSKSGFPDLLISQKSADF